MPATAAYNNATEEKAAIGNIKMKSEGCRDDASLGRKETTKSQFV